MLAALRALVRPACMPPPQQCAASEKANAAGAVSRLLDAHPPRSRHISLPLPLPLPLLAWRLEAEQADVVAPGCFQPVLAQVSFVLARGDVLGVIGPSAGGKSSPVRVLVGAWQLAAGYVRLDGADLRQRNADELGPALGYLPQAVSLFAGTVGENIARFGARWTRAAWWRRSSWLACAT